MKIYDLIQELTNYDADDEVTFRVIMRDYRSFVTAEFNRKSEDDEQEIEVTLDIEETVDFDCIDKPYSWPKNSKEVRIDLVY